MRNLSAWIGLLLLSPVFGCSSSTPPGADGGLDAGSGVDAGSADSGTDAGNGTTVKSLRMTPPSSGTPVSVPGVVVVGHVTNKAAGSIWVQDPGGGAYSGIQLFCNYDGGAATNCSMSKSQIDNLALAAVVNVTGNFQSVVPAGAPAGAQPVLRLDAPVVVTTGGNIAPVAVPVAGSVVAKDQQAAAPADPYKGSYVQVGGGPYSVSNNAAPEFLANCSGGTTYTGFEASDAGVTLAIGLTFYDSLTYCFSVCGLPCSNPVTNQSFTLVQGVVEPSFDSLNGSVFLMVSPVQDSDLLHN